MTTTWFAILWLWIGLASSWDLYLGLRWIECPADELNPLAALLIHQGGLPMLAAAKMAGTIIALGLLALLRIKHADVATVAIYCLAAVQLAVALFLYFA